MTSTKETVTGRRRFWRRCRIYFRGFRIAVWLLVLLAVSVVVYLNQVGLPRFIKDPLLQKLRGHGVDLQFSRLRWRFHEGIVAENVHFGSTDESRGPRLDVQQVRVLLNLQALLHRRLQVDKLALLQGRLVWPVPAPGAAPEDLEVRNIQTDLRFLPGDQWGLDNFKADFAGAKITLSGLVTNASAVQTWEFLKGGETAPGQVERWPARLQRLSATLKQIGFAAEPDLRLDISGDARDLQTFTVLMLLSAPGADTPWGTLTRGRFKARLFAADTNGVSRAEMSLEAAEAKTRWASARQFKVTVEATAQESETNLVRGRLRLTAHDARTEWASVTNLALSAVWLHSITNPVPISGEGAGSFEGIETRWGQLRKLDIGATLGRPHSGELPPFDPEAAWWTNIQAYALNWSCQANDFHSPKIDVATVVSSGGWRAPILTVTNLQARLYEAGISASGTLDVLSRKTRLQLRSDLDPKRIAPLLSDPAARWLEQFSWDAPPRADGQLEFVLPAWTNRAPDWRAELQPTLNLAGEFDLVGGAYRDVRFSTVQGHVSYSNMCWHLPDLTLRRPEGTLLAEHRADDRTGDFYWRLRSSVDVQLVRPFLDTEAQKAFDLLKLTSPPIMDAQIQGRFHQPERIGFRGSITLTNFSFRGEPFSWLATGASYTNQVLEFDSPRVGRGQELAAADGLRADFNRGLVFLTNGVSSMEPMVIAHAVGDQVAKAISPFQFGHPPAARVQGIIPMRGEADADLTFDLSGGPFAWWKFHVPQISGRVHWRGTRVALEKVRMDFYGGQAGGAADLAFPPEKPGTDFEFTLNVTNILLHALMSDLASPTNELDGFLNGTVAITQGNSEDISRLFGYGNLSLRDGLIWDIPIFGVLTPVLNGISPGLGNSRAGAGSCSFTITNGFIRSDNLEIRSPAVRLLYRGTIDLDGNLNARVEAELMRDVRVLGPIVSTVFWPVSKMFEYRLTGTFSQPKTEPVYIIPKLMLMPFHPFRTLKNLLPATPSITNPPPAVQYPPPPGQ